MMILVITIPYGGMNSMISKPKLVCKYAILSVILISIILIIFISFVRLNKSTSLVENEKIKVYTEEEMQARYRGFDSLLKELGYNTELINHNKFSDEDINRFLHYSVGAGEERWELVKIMCQKQGNWHNLPISQIVKDKYEKTGLLPDEKFDRIEFWEYEGEEYIDAPYGRLSGTPRFILWNGSEKKRVVVFLNNDEHCKGILTVDKINIFTEEEYNKCIETNTNNLGHKWEVTEELWDLCATALSNSKLKRKSLQFDNESVVGMTDKFLSKYPFFLDAFIHYSPQDYNEIELIEISDYKDLTAKYRVNSDLEGKVRDYEVKFILDRNLYIDDVEVKLVVEKKKESWNGADLRLLYKNSDIIGLNISKELRIKYQEYGSYNKDIDLINVDIPIVYKIINNDWNEQIQQFTLNDGNTAFYYVKIISNDKEIINDENKIEDIICYKLPYENMTIDKVLDSYLANK